MRQPVKVVLDILKPEFEMFTERLQKSVVSKSLKDVGISSSTDLLDLNDTPFGKTH